MAVTEQTPIQAYTASGSSAVFAYGFQVLDAGDMSATIDGVAIASSAYTVSGVANPSGGTVTFVTTPTAGARVVLFRDSALTRSTDYQSNGDLLAAVVNRDFDRLWLVIQEMNQGGKAPTSAVRAPAGETLTELPIASVRAGKLMAFDDDGNPTTAGPVAGTATALAAALADTDGASLVGRGGSTVDDDLTAVEAAVTDAASDAADALALERAVINILPNSRWYVCTGINVSPAYGPTGSVLPNVNVSSYTTGANVITCNTSDTSSLTVGRLVAFGGAAHANLKITACRVLSIVANTSFTCRLPNGLTAPSSAACIATPVESGGSGSSVTGYGFDWWYKTEAMEFWREWPGVNTVAGSKYSCGLKKAGAGPEYYSHRVDARDLAAVVGKTFAHGGWVKCPTGGSWRVYIHDSVNGYRYGSLVTTTGFTWSEVSAPIASAATSVEFGFEFFGASGLRFYLSQPFAGQGNVIGPTGGPPNLAREYIVPLVKYTPQSYYNANITFTTTADVVGRYSMVFDVYAETGGTFAPEVRALDVLLEGIQFGAVITGDGGRALVTRDQIPVPHKYGPIMFQQVAEVKTVCGGVWTLGADGTGVLDSGSGYNWANVSLDINGVWA